MFTKFGMADFKQFEGKVLGWRIIGSVACLGLLLVIIPL